MSVSSPSSLRSKEGGDANGFFAEAFWLARKEMKRAWLSYPLSGLFVLSLGLFAVPALSGVFELEGSGMVGLRVEEHYNDFLADYLFLVVGAFLGVNAISRDYTLASWQNTCASRLLFLRELPIGADSLMGSRMLSMLSALFLYALAFFLPPYFLTDLGQIGTAYLYSSRCWRGLPFAASRSGTSLGASAHE